MAHVSGLGEKSKVGSSVRKEVTQDDKMDISNIARDNYVLWVWQIKSC